VPVHIHARRASLFPKSVHDIETAHCHLHGAQAQNNRGMSHTRDAGGETVQGRIRQLEQSGRSGRIGFHQLGYLCNGNVLFLDQLKQLDCNGGRTG